MIYRMFHPPPLTSLQYSVYRVMGLRSSVILENRDSQNSANLTRFNTETTTSKVVLTCFDNQDTLQARTALFVRGIKHSELNLNLFMSLVKYMYMLSFTFSFQ